MVTRVRPPGGDAVPSLAVDPGSTQTRSWTWRGFGQSIPKNRMIAPASPAPLTPLDSAIVASPTDRLPPGRIAGARTSIAASRNLRAAASC